MIINHKSFFSVFLYFCFAFCLGVSCLFAGSAIVLVDRVFGLSNTSSLVFVARSQQIVPDEERAKFKQEYDQWQAAELARREAIAQHGVLQIMVPRRQ